MPPKYGTERRALLCHNNKNHETQDFCQLVRTLVRKWGSHFSHLAGNGMAGQGQPAPGALSSRVTPRHLCSGLSLTPWPMPRPHQHLPAIARGPGAGNTPACLMSPAWCPSHRGRQQVSECEASRGRSRGPHPSPKTGRGRPPQRTDRLPSLRAAH